MKKTRLFFLLTGFVVGLLALCWSRAQNPTHPLKVINPSTGMEIHTLMIDQHNALVGYLEAAGQTNALELLRQYRCAYRADLSSSELGDTVATLRYLRQGDKNQAIQLLEQRLSRYADLMRLSYGGLNPTNRGRVDLASLKQAQEYFAEFPSPTWGPEMDKGVNKILRLNETSTK